MQDEELAKRLQQGDQIALVELVARHHSPLIGYLYRLTNGDRPLAEDLAQDAFVRLIQGIQQYQYPRPFKPWLYRIATNAARDVFKSAHNRRAVSIDEENAAMFQETTQPEEVIMSESEMNRVALAFRCLPHHQKEVVILRYYQELSLNDIADALDIPLGTVKSRLSLGLTRLRTLLTEQDNARLPE
jgi:RNA polymerase sigma-70 factor, ECF subfamily